MKRELFITLCGVMFIIMLVAALFTNKNAQDAAGNALHEIKTFDAWKQSAYAPGPNCPIYPQAQTGGANYYPYQAAGLQQAAVQAAPPIMAGQDAPVLIKQLGVEGVGVGGGKVKITGVMGSSWADKAGLKEGDIILTFDTKKITSLEQFQALLAKAPPEKNYKVTYLRGTRKQKCVVTVGEGEMEGFVPLR